MKKHRKEEEEKNKKEIKFETQRDYFMIMLGEYRIKNIGNLLKLTFLKE